MLFFHLFLVVSLTLFTINSASSVTTIAGGASASSELIGSNQLARDVNFGRISYICNDISGNLFASLPTHHVIARIDGSSNEVTIIAGSLDTAVNYHEQIPTSQPLSLAGFLSPKGIWIDNNGNLFVADGNFVVRMIDSQFTTVTRVAGSGRAGHRQTNPVLQGSPTAVDLGGPSSVWGDGKGNLYIYDLGCIFVSSGTYMSVFAGQWNQLGFVTNPSPTAIKMRGSGQISGDPSGNILFTDAGNGVVWRVSPAGVASILAGSTAGSAMSCSSDSLHPLCLTLQRPFGIWSDEQGQIFFTSTHMNHENFVPDQVLSLSSVEASTHSKVFSPTNNPLGLSGDKKGNVFVSFSEGINRYSAATSRRLRASSF